MMSPEHVLFGSDYPHPEGMADPLGQAMAMGTLFSRADAQKILGGNLYGLLGLRPRRSPR
jgi:predicted TIM-barrel fold metal-dependent hydrolase